jgi:GT2 family glycosyltransferase
VWKNDYLSLGAGMAIRRAALADIAGFDELLGPGAVFQAAEDNDLAWRALVKGWSVYENADVSVLHDGFRSLEELRELVKRDFYGVGGTIAKYLKSGHWQISSLLFSWMFRFGIMEPVRDLLARRYPRGFRRPYMLLRGLVDGLRTPIDVATLRYRERDPGRGPN